MPRYVLFVSAATALVTNPHPDAINAKPARFAGRRLRATPPSPKVLPDDEHPDLIDHYEVIPEGEVLIDDPHLRKAASRGDGEILCVVTAKTRAEADKLFEDDKAKRGKTAQTPAAPKPSTTIPAATTAPLEVK